MPEDTTNTAGSKKQKVAWIAIGSVLACLIVVGAIVLATRKDTPSPAVEETSTQISDNNQKEKSKTTKEQEKTEETERSENNSQNLQSYSQVTIQSKTNESQNTTNPISGKDNNKQQEVEAPQEEVVQKETISVSLENDVLQDYMRITDYSDDPDYTRSVAVSFISAHKIQDDQITNYVKSRPAPVPIEFDKQTGVNKYYISINEGSHIIQEFEIDITQATGSGANYAYDATGDVVKFDVYNLVPNKEYDYRIYKKQSATSAKTLIVSGKIETEGQVRMLYVNNIYNVRDIGGWQTNDGKTLKYSKIFRGTELDGLSGRGFLESDGLAVFNSLGITSEIDLDGAVSEGNVHLEDYSSFTVWAYENGLANTSAMYKNIINKVAENIHNGIGTYIHCQAGLDRTGTAIFLIEGLLGIDEDHMAMDYEISTMNHGVPDVNDPTKTKSSLGYRNYNDPDKPTYKKMVAWIKTNYPGENLNESIEKYCKAIGITNETISALRNEMLE